MSRKRANLHVPTPVRTRVATLSPNPNPDPDPSDGDSHGGSPDPLDSIPRGPIGSRDSISLEEHVPTMSGSDSQSQSTSVGTVEGRGKGRGRGRGGGGASRQSDRSVSTTSSTRITRNTSSSRSISPIKSSLPLTTPATQGQTPTPRLASRYTSTSRSTSPIKPSPSLPTTTPMLVQTQRNRPGLATRSSSRSISPIKKTSAASLEPSRSASPIKQSRSTSPVKAVNSVSVLEQDTLQQQSKRTQPKAKQVENVKRKSSELPPDDDLSDDDDEKVYADVAEPMPKRRKVKNEEDGQDANAEEKDEEGSQVVEIQTLDKAEDNMVEEIHKEEERNSSMGFAFEGREDDGGGIATNEDKVEQRDEDDRDQELAPTPDSDFIEATDRTPIDMPQMDDTGSQPVKTDTEGGLIVASTAQPAMTQGEVDNGAELSDSDEKKGEESADDQVVIDVDPVLELEIRNNSVSTTAPMHDAEKITLQEPVADSPVPAIATEGSIITNDNILPAATLGPIQAAQPDIPISEIETAGDVPDVDVAELEKRQLSGENEAGFDKRMSLDKQNAEFEEITVDGEIAAYEETDKAVQGSFTESRAGAGLPTVQDTLLESEETEDNVPFFDVVNAPEPSTAVAVEKETAGGNGEESVDVVTGGEPIEGEESIEIENGSLSQAVGAEAEEEEEKETTDVKQTIDAVQGMDVDLPVPITSGEIAPDQPLEAPDALMNLSTEEVDIETSVKADNMMDVDTTVPSATDVTLAAGDTALPAVMKDDHQPAVEQRQQLPVEVNVTTVEEGDEGEEEIEQEEEQEEEMSATPAPAPAQTASPAKSSTSVATATTTTTGKGKNTTKTKKVAGPKKAIAASNKKAAGVKGKKTKVEEIKGGEKGRSSSLSERSQTPQPSEEPSSSSLLLNSNGNTNSPSKHSPSKSAAGATGGTSSCICRKSYDDDDEDVTWLGCESCDGWFHASCVGVQAEMIKMLDVFICKKCERTTAQRTIYKKVCKREGCSKSIDGSSSKFCSPSCAFRHSTTLLSGLNNKNALKGLAKSFIAFPQPHLGVSVVQHRPQSTMAMNTDVEEKKDQEHHEAIRSLRRQIDVVESALEILKKREDIFKNTLEKCDDLLAVAVTIQVDGDGEAGEKKKKGRGRGRLATNGNGEGGGGKDERACGWGDLLIADDDYIRDYQIPQNAIENENGQEGNGTREICLMPRRKCDRHQGWQKIVERSLETEQQTMIAMRDKLNERKSNLELEYQNQQSSSEARTSFAARAKGVR